MPQTDAPLSAAELAALEPDLQVDARFTLCPMPIVKTAQALEPQPIGVLARVRATDAGVARDLPAWCRVQGQAFLGCVQENGEWVGYVRKIVAS
ncbi:sulfurtransferase TusA family protein [Magnetofaba australis]|uniref:Putative SirA family protein n=1 Tax=Magnetofaba australis IT-1 TaxID=1434232 RepID=A0A1Y2K8F4_9PROT|nr:sulfurtransferase TusA family protein [Magnetofaba australis]OSM07040.1 putative SirA family protein [Magnetofaba australis IT-1]